MYLDLGRGDAERSECPPWQCRVVYVIFAAENPIYISIGEICHCVLDRGEAVGTGRELPAHPRVPP